MSLIIREQPRYHDFEGFFLARLTLTFQFRSKPYIEKLLWQHLLVGDEGLRGSHFTPSSIPNLYCSKNFFKRVMMGLSVCIEDAHTQINLVCHLASPT